jgi:hypothetical protein
MTISVTVFIFRNQCGFVARALELPVVSAPVNTQRGAVKNLKDKLKTYLDDLAEHKGLSRIIDDAGFRGWIGRGGMKVDFNDRVSIALPVPRNALPELEP